MNKTSMIFILALGLLLPAAAVPAQAQGARDSSLSIAAVVNQDAISEADVRDRLRLILASSGLPDTPDMRQRALKQVLDSLVDEQIKMQEAARNDLTISQEEIDGAFGRIAGNNNLTAERFASALQQQGVKRNTLDRQIKAQLAWNKVIQKTVRPQISVSPSDVAALKERMRLNIGKTEFLVSEIFLPVDDQINESDVRQLANKLVSELGEGKAPFAAVARQVSRGAGSEKGGDMGWMQEGRLPDDFDAALKVMPEGAISQPIRGANGYHILHLRKKRIFAEENIPSDDDLTDQIGFERLDRAQQRYLLDLKSAAFIERRV